MNVDPKCQPHPSPRQLHHRTETGVVGRPGVNQSLWTQSITSTTFSSTGKIRVFAMSPSFLIDLSTLCTKDFRRNNSSWKSSPHSPKSNYFKDENGALASIYQERVTLMIGASTALSMTCNVRPTLRREPLFRHGKLGSPSVRARPQGNDASSTKHAHTFSGIIQDIIYIPDSEEVTSSKWLQGESGKLRKRMRCFRRSQQP